MAVADVQTTRIVVRRELRASVAPIRRPRDLQRTFQLVLSTVWLLDAVLQLQPFMFTPGANGFSGMLASTAPTAPGWVSHLITWNASVVDHDPVLTNTLFVGIQFVIAFGIIWQRTIRPALLLSVVWAIGVWWFGEGAGGIFSGRATPLGGGPGGVLFYAVLAVLLWPAEPQGEPFLAARAIGTAAAKWIWSGLWAVLAVLAVVGAGRNPQALRGLVSGMDSGEPGWLSHIDGYSGRLLLQHGTAIAIGFAVLCVAIGLAVHLTTTVQQVAVTVAIVAFALIWVAVQNVGGILAGGATDPNSGLLVIILALTYWPLRRAVPPRSFAEPDAGGARCC